MSEHQGKGPDRDDGDDLGRIYSSLDQPGSPAELDAAIRAAAHAALETPAVPARSKQRRWYRMAGLAAVVVLSASVVILVPRYQDPVPRRQLPQPASVAPEPAPEAEAPRALESKKKAADTKREDSRLREQALDAPEQELQRSVGEQLQSPAEKPAALPGFDDQAAGNAGRSSVASPGLASEAAQQNQPQLLEESLDADSGFDYRASPELWIGHIESLLAQGRFEEAQREFEAFRQAHPQHSYAQSR